MARLSAMRRARAASIELHQFADRVIATNPAWAPSGKLGDLRVWLTDNHIRRIEGRPVEDVRILGAVADAFKHAKLDNPAAKAFLESDEAIVCIGTGYGRLAFGEGKPGGEQVIVELRDGTQRALSLVLMTVRDGWAAAMGRERQLIDW
jgi:hypothetical protein